MSSEAERETEKQTVQSLDSRWTVPVEGETCLLPVSDGGPLATKAIERQIGALEGRLRSPECRRRRQAEWQCPRRREGWKWRWRWREEQVRGRTTAQQRVKVRVQVRLVMVMMR